MNFKKLPEITKKQKEILYLIFRFRFINRKQLQRYLKHKDARRINTWLKDLVAKNYLGRKYSKKLLENTKPAIYYLNNNGIIWVRWEKEIDLKYLKKFYEDKKASEAFINHCVSIFEFYLPLKEAEDESNETLEYGVSTKTELWIEKQEERFEDFSEIKNILPDLYIEKLTDPYNEHIASSTYFLELFDPRMPQYAIKYKIKQIIRFKENNNWEFYTGIDKKFPIIMLVFPNQQKINFLSKFIREQLERSYDSDDLIFRVTTYKKAMTEGITNVKIWQEIKE